MPQNTKITMKRALPLLALLLLCASCSRTVQRQAPAFRLEADTLRQGGLELLHNIAIVDAEGTVLFTDSTTDFEPDHFSVFVPDSTHPEACYLLLMVFNPCEDRTLVLRSDGQTLRSQGIFPSDSIPTLTL